MNASLDEQSVERTQSASTMWGPIPVCVLRATTSLMEGAQVRRQIAASRSQIKELV